MAAPTVNAVRVRLYFDYPPPAVADCRMCWLLVDLNQCRVVADLASIIRDRFDFSRRTVLNLSMQDCYLPPTESIHVIRDNDSVRVKVEKVADANGPASCSPRRTWTSPRGGGGAGGRTARPASCSPRRTWTSPRGGGGAGGRTARPASCSLDQGPGGGLGPRGGRGRARAGPRNHVYYNYNGSEQQCDSDALTNSSVVLQNPAADVPKRDYSLLPLLAAPPAVGQLIAFKEGRIVGFDQSTRQLELELLSSAPDPVLLKLPSRWLLSCLGFNRCHPGFPAAPAEPGKFDLVYHTPDGAEIVEYAVSRGSKLTERWDSLLEPRLIVDGAERGPAGAAD
ncbi:COIL protein, partial [Atractosteus spatula]|nr:COIL protein [Atractosteus spatula]